MEKTANTKIKTNDAIPYAKCVDVSSYQGNIDWHSAKDAGIHHAILKIIRKDLKPDTKFEQNWKGCQNANVAVDGVYNYSYATSVEKAKTDAKKVLSVLNGRKCIVWLDLEDKCQQGLGPMIKDIINSYQDVILSAGYEFGIYTGPSFFNPFLKPYFPQIECSNFWLARYYNSYRKMDLSVCPNERYNPKLITGFDSIYAWQYTSSGQVPGISGNVDLSVIYGNASDDYTGCMKGRVSNCTKLNLRKEPKVAANNIVSVLDVNDEVFLKEKINGWYKVATKNNLAGYVSGKYITILS